MTMIRNTKIAVVLVIFALASGCHLPNSGRLDASSQEQLTRSLNAMVDGASGEEKVRLAKVRDRFTQAYLITPSAGVDRLPDYHAVDKMDRAEFLSFARVLDPPPPPVEPESARPSRFVTQRYRSTLDLYEELLEDAKDRAHRARHFTVDEFAWGPPRFNAPAGDLTAGDDGHATITIPFTNRTGFDVYAPQFRLRIQEAGQEFPIFDDVLKPVNVSLIRRDETVAAEYWCCAIGDGVKLNAVVRNLKSDTKINYELVAVNDFSKTNRLETKIFTQHDFDELKRTIACRADIDSRPEQWTPDNAVVECSGPSYFQRVSPENGPTLPIEKIGDDQPVAVIGGQAQ